MRLTDFYLPDHAKGQGAESASISAAQVSREKSLYR